MAETALVCTSHSPLMGFSDPGPGIRERVDAAFASARAFIEDFAPDLVVLFGPDHYNGVFYDMMPPFCVGAAATSIGDYDTPAGDLLVDRDAAYAILRHVLACDIDMTLSERMYVDHGFAQPLQLLLGGLDRVPVVPIFVNSVAEPLGPPRRARQLGRAVGDALQKLSGRVLLVGSGGLSHDPPAPRLADADEATAARIISEGRALTPAQRAEREMRTIRAGQDMAVGTSTLQPLNSEWDRLVLDVLADGDLDRVDTWTTEWFIEQAGHSSHEVRTWIAAYAALAVNGRYCVTSRFYEAIPAWIAGFAVTQAVSQRAATAHSVPKEVAR
ncbi:MAG TPA: 3-carboxyethylcatechol 2,3-dioxygenase [Pseudonocardia sp.]